MSLSRILGKSVLYLAAFSAVFPMVWTAINAFKNRVDIVTPTPLFLFTPTLDNFAYVLGRDSVAAGLVNSLIAAGGSVLVGALLGLPAAYAIARYPNRWSADIQFFVLSLRFLPPVAVAIPLMVIWLDLGFYDTQISLVVTYTLLTLATVIWLGVPAPARIASSMWARIRRSGPSAASAASSPSTSASHLCTPWVRRTRPFMPRSATSSASASVSAIASSIVQPTRGSAPGASIRISSFLCEFQAST